MWTDKYAPPLTYVLFGKRMVHVLLAERPFRGKNMWPKHGFLEKEHAKKKKKEGSLMSRAGPPRQVALR
jgi:hypothetical protein